MRSSKEIFKQFLLGATIVSLISTAGYFIAPIEVRFLKSLTENPTLIGMAFGLGSILLGFFSIYLGKLSDRVGRKRFVLIGCFLSVLYPLLYATSYNIFQYMGVKFVWAFAAASTGPLLTAYLQDILKYSNKQGQYFGTMYSIQSLLGAGAQFAGGLLSEKFGFSAPYFAMSLVFALATILTLFALSSKRSTLAHKKNLSKELSPKSFFWGFKYLLQKPQLLFYLLINSAFGVNWGIKGMLWPLIIFSISGKDSVTGSIFATMGVVAFFSLFFAGKFTDKIGPFKGGFISVFFQGSAGLVLALTGDITIFWIGAAIYAIGEAFNGPYQAIILTKYVDSNHRGEILGFDLVIDKTLQTFAPFLAGFLLHLLSPQKILFIFILFFWAALLVGLSIYNTKIKQLRL